MLKKEQEQKNFVLCAILTIDMLQAYEIDGTPQSNDTDFTGQ